jgi:pimeloyl-ACP methyl ester carboxylesterase
MDVERYSQLHMVGDMVGLLDALGESSCVIIGHDWGAAVAWNAALIRPDRFRAVAGISLPFTGWPTTSPTKALREATGDAFNYMLYFQEPGVAEAELERDVARTVRSLLYSASGEGAPKRRALPVVPANGTYLQGMIDPGTLPPWIGQPDFDFLVAELQRTGLRGGLNWYRNLDRDWELMSCYRDARIVVPGLFVAGAQDTSIVKNRHAVDSLPKHFTNFTGSVVVPGCGHWSQQERPDEVNAALLGFLSGLSA